MIFLASLFDATFVHMAVGFLGMLVGAFLIIGVSGVVGQRQMQAQASGHGTHEVRVQN
jgi:hypothetical protein